MFLFLLRDSSSFRPFFARILHQWLENKCYFFLLQVVQISSISNDFYRYLWLHTCIFKNSSNVHFLKNFDWLTQLSLQTSKRASQKSKNMICRIFENTSPCFVHQLYIPTTLCNEIFHYLITTISDIYYYKKKIPKEF